jgi:hypothetical protein
MEKQVQIFSEAFCPVNITDHFTVTLSEDFWGDILSEHQEGRCFLHLQVGDSVWIAPVGQPVKSNQFTQSTVYLPLWMLDSAGFQGIGETAMCTVLNNEAFPNASKITLRVIDSAFYTSEVKEELELALSSLGIVRKHSVLQIPIQSLSGYRVEVFVSNTEPCDILLCEGDEVIVEFEEPVDHYEPPPRVPTPTPSVEPMLLPAEPDPTTGFVPFGGQGRALGNCSATTPPEWRRNLPPRRQP